MKATVGGSRSDGLGVKLIDVYRTAINFCRAGNFHQSYVFARKAMEMLPRTPNENEIYKWKAANAAATAAYMYSCQPDVDEHSRNQIRAEGRLLAQTALQNHPCKECRNNLLFYASNAADAFEHFKLKQIEFEPPAPYVPMNPSVWLDGDVRRCVVRNVNYLREKGKSWTALEDEVRTRNYALEFDETWNVVKAVEIADLAERPRTSVTIRGYEDCRAFQIGSQNFCIATVCDTNEAGIQEMALLELDENYAVTATEILRGPWSPKRQKNWPPLVKDDRVFFIYSIRERRALVIQYDRSVWLRVDSTEAPNFEPGSFRGGSQAIAVPGGWLLLGHETIDENADRTYLHRFLLLSDDFEVVAASEAFYFKQRGIEFCAGLVRDGNQLVASFGVDDREAWLAFFSVDEVLASLSANNVNGVI